MTVRALQLAASLVLACTARAPVDTAAGSSTGEPASSTTGEPATTDAPTTTAASTTTTTDVTTGDTDPTENFADSWPFPAGFVGCTSTAPTGAQLVGQTDAGPFHSARGYFGVVHWQGEEITKVLFYFFDDSVSQAAIETQLEEPKFEGQYAEMDFKLGPRPFPAEKFGAGFTAHRDGDQGSLGVWVSDLEPAGGWDALDPDDPPRIRGRLDSLGLQFVEGTFDAVYCENLNRSVTID